MPMGPFFSAMFAEMGARRRRLREALGDRGQALFEFLILAGLMLGSFGLFLRPWMAAAAPWGFAMPVVFVAGYLVIEARRQRAVKPDAGEAAGGGFDWLALLWALGCAALGAAAFAIAWTSDPWAPVENAVTTDIIIGP